MFWTGSAGRWMMRAVELSEPDQPGAAGVHRVVAGTAGSYPAARGAGKTAAGELRNESCHDSTIIGNLWQVVFFVFTELNSHWTNSELNSPRTSERGPPHRHLDPG